MKDVDQSTQKDIDLEIVRRVKTGETEAFGELMERYEHRLSRYLSRFLADKDMIADVLQDTLVKAYVNIQSFDEAYTFSSWIYRIAHNEAVNMIKRKKATPFSWFEPEALVPYFAHHDRTEKEVDQEFLKKELEKVLATLPPHYREILILSYYEELSYKEIALILRIPVASVGVRINRAKKKAFEEILVSLPHLHEHHS